MVYLLNGVRNPKFVELCSIYHFFAKISQILRLNKILSKVCRGGNSHVYGKHNQFLNCSFIFLHFTKNHFKFQVDLFFNRSCRLVERAQITTQLKSLTTIIRPDLWPQNNSQRIKNNNNQGIDDRGRCLILLATLLLKIAYRQGYFYLLYCYGLLQKLTKSAL